MKYFFLITVSIVLISSCGPKVSEEPEKLLIDSQSTVHSATNESWKIDFPSNIDRRKDVSLSDIAKNVSYIKMETSSQYLIGEKGLSIKPCGEFIFVGQHDSPIGVFDRKGKFLRTIGKIGKGPEEFNNDYLYYPEEKGQKVVVANAFRSSLMEYSWEGELLGEFKPDVRPFHFAPIDKDIYLVWSGIQQEDSVGYYRLAFFSSDGIPLRRIYENKIELAIGMRMGFLSPLITPAVEGKLYNSWETNIIYRILPDTLMIPALTWDLGKYEMPFDPMDDFARYDREKHKYVRDINAVEGIDYWYIKYFYKSGLEMGIFSKKTGELFTINNADKEQNGLYNDIDGGPSFWPFWDAEEGGIYYKMIPAVELLSNDAEQLNYSGSPKNPAKAKEFQDLLKSLKETDNPILMRVQLK
jgi:hypothetical protein